MTAVAWAQEYRSLAQRLGAGYALSRAELHDLERTRAQAHYRARGPDTRAMIAHWDELHAYVRRAELFARLRRGDLLLRDYQRLSGAHQQPLADSVEYVQAGGGYAGFAANNILFQWNETDTTQFATAVTTATETVTWSAQAISATEVSARIRATCTWSGAELGGSHLPIALASMVDLTFPTATHCRCVPFVRAARSDDVAADGLDYSWQGVGLTNKTFTVNGLYGTVVGVAGFAANAQVGLLEGAVATNPPFTLGAAFQGPLAFIGVLSTGAPAMGQSYQHIFDANSPGGGSPPVVRAECVAVGLGSGNTTVLRAPTTAIVTIGTDASWNDKVLNRVGLFVHANAPGGGAGAPPWGPLVVEFADFLVYKHWMDWV